MNIAFHYFRKSTVHSETGIERHTKVPGSVRSVNLKVRFGSDSVDQTIRIRSILFGLTQTGIEFGVFGSVPSLTALQ